MSFNSFTASGYGFMLSAFNWYGFLIGGAMLASIVAAYYLLKKRGYNPDIVFNIALVCLPSAIIGLRIYYVVFDILGGDGTVNEWFKPYGKFTILKFIGFDKNASGKWEFVGLQGLALYGGLIAAALGAIIVRAINRKNKNPYNHMTYVQMLDAFFILIIIGQAIGRWGNFANQEAYGNYIGQKSWFPYGVKIDNPHDGGTPGWYQATFFYESFWNFIGFFLMLYLWLGKRKSFDGFVFSFYCIWYGTIRLLVEGLRSDSLYIGSIRVSQLVSGILILYGAATIIYHVVMAKRTGKKILIYVDESKLDLSYYGYEKTKMYINSVYGKDGKPLDGGIINNDVGGTDNHKDNSDDNTDLKNENTDIQTKSESTQEEKT